MEEEKLIRIGKALKELGVGFVTAKKFLESKGFSDINPNSKLDETAYDSLRAAFSENGVAEEAPQLQTILHKSLDILRGHGVNPWEYMVVPLLLTLKRKSTQEDWQFLRSEMHHNALPYEAITVGRKTLIGIDDLWNSIDRVSPKCLSALIELLSTIDTARFSDESFGRLFDGALMRLSEWMERQGPVFILPQEVTELMNQFVPKHDGVSVFNPFAGVASFALNLPVKSSYTGQEINAMIAALGRLRIIAHNIGDADLLNEMLVDADSISCWPYRQFDCIISSPPFGLRINEMIGFESNQRQVEGFVLEQTLRTLNIGGVAVYLMGNNVLSAGGSIGRVREELLRKGAIRYVIALPERIFPSTGIKTCIIVLEKARSSGGDVTLVDASQCVVRTSSRQNIVDVESILELMQQRPKQQVITVGISELEESDFQLTPLRYLPLETQDVLQHDTIELRELVSIGGARVQSGIGRFIRIRDLQSTEILLPLNLDEVELSPFSRPAKAVSGTALLVATTGNDLKPTLLRSKETIYVSSDIVPLSVDQNMVDPMFLRHQLNTPFVKEQVERLLTGATIPHLVLNDLLSIKIELPPLEVQEKLLSDIKENLILLRQKGLDEMSEQLGLKKADQDSQLRHQIAGPLKNSRHALTSIMNIFKKYPAFEQLSLDGKSKTVGTYLARIERDLGNIHSSVITAGKTIQMLDMNMEKLDIIALTRSYADELRERVNGQYQVDFWFDEDSLREGDIDGVFILCDRSFLRTIYDNIVSNAEKHAFAGTENQPFRLDIGILFNFEDATVQVDFSNTGNPFPKSLKWANAIRKGGAFGSSAGDGTGLWLVNELMERHGGSLDFTDETGPDGIHTDLVSTFELYFPIAID